MPLDLLRDRGTPLDQQRFTWRELAPPTISKLDCDAWTRIRIILMNGLESEAVRFSHACARLFGGLQQPLAVIRRVEQHQQTMVNWLLPADQTPLETTIAFEQVAIEVTAAIAEVEPDAYLASMYRFGLLEDFDHLYRFSALMDRIEGKDSSAILQGYTDILPGRPTSLEHRHPLDELCHGYDHTSATLLTKLGALTLVASENQTRDYYMTIGPQFADPAARALYAEIASIEEQHVTRYETLIDPQEAVLEKWLLHEASEAYNYWSCVESETDDRIRTIWERMLDYELGHVQFVAELYERHLRRDAAQVLDTAIDHPMEYRSHRELVREVLRREAGYGADGPRLTRTRDDEPERTRLYRARMNSKDQPSNIVSAGWSWRPGGELTADGAAPTAPTPPTTPPPTRKASA
ncbi:MAG: hypothetical protein H0T79_20470 [Deltaproteobacteria bacterium]|nr:hypothetical protein [Deltaproteobacteria bacterium]